MRTASSLEELPCEHVGQFNSFYTIPTAAGPREVIARNQDKGSLGAAKMITLYLPLGADTGPGVRPLVQGPNPTNTLRSLIGTIMKSGVQNWYVQILAVDRPVTRVTNLPVELTENYQLELPGGIANMGESLQGAAVREAVEEYGLTGPEAIVQYAPLVDFPAANDAGSNIEVYQAWIALTRQEPQPPAREGIYPEHCQLVPLTAVGPWLSSQGGQGIAIEWLAWGIVHQLATELLGGWETVQQLQT